MKVDIHNIAVNRHHTLYTGIIIKEDGMKMIEEPMQLLFLLDHLETFACGTRNNKIHPFRRTHIIHPLPIIK